MIRIKTSSPITPHRYYKLAVCLSALLWPALCPAESSIELEQMVVVAAKQAQALIDVANTVQVITAEDIETSLAQNLDQALRYQAALNSESAGVRFANTGINIRGIGGDRVAVEIDGIPAQNLFAIGNFANTSRDLLETSLVKRAEILNGPASTLYGSDAIGGVISIHTWDPADLVAGGENLTYAQLSGSYHGENRSLAVSGLAAWANNRSGILAGITRRDGHETQNQAINGPEDRQTWESTALFLKSTWDTPQGNQWMVTAQEFQRDRDSDLRSFLGSGRFRRTTQLNGDDQDQARSVALSFDFYPQQVFDQGSWSVYHQDSSTEQLTLEERANSTNPVLLNRDFFFSQTLNGTELNLFRSVQSKRARHHLGVGFEYTHTTTKERRDGLQTSLLDGSTSKTILGETFPVRDFPNSRTRQYGVFVYDEVRPNDSAWTLIPALRFDYYSLNPSTDSIFLEDNPSNTIVSLSDHAVSPKLGFTYALNKHWRLFGQYARGFRAPPFEDVNIGLDIPLFNIRAIPNPELKSETSDGYELGIRQVSDRAQLSLAGFWNDYSDFIESKARIGLDPDTGTLLFQSRNIADARIYGLDFSASFRLHEAHHKLQNWTLDFNGYWARGENRETGQPLNSISPAQLISGLHWDSPDRQLSVSLLNTVTRHQTNIDESNGIRFPTPGYGIVDLLIHWQPSDNFRLSTGLFNLSDKKYWRWSDVANFDRNDPLIETLSRPGRSANLTLRWNWP